MLAFYLICEYLVNDKKYSKHYYGDQIGSQVFHIECGHCELRTLYIMILTYIFKVTNLEMQLS